MSQNKAQSVECVFNLLILILVAFYENNEKQTGNFYV